MSKTNVLENDIQKYLFQKIVPAWAGDNQFYVSLHTGDPGEAGTQASNEVAYTGYARVLVQRPAGWVVTNDTSANAAETSFPVCTGAGDDVTVTHFGIGTSLNGAGVLLEKGPLSSALRITLNVRPSFAQGALTSTED
jgi:hypothetical protein